MKGQSQEAFFVFPIAILHAVRDVKKDLRFLNAVIVLEDMDSSLLNSHKDTVTTIVGVVEQHGSQERSSAVVAIRFPTGPLQVGERRHGLQPGLRRVAAGIGTIAIANLDISKSDFVTVILQADMPLGVFGKTLVIGELTFGDALIPIGVSDREAVVSNAIDVHRTATLVYRQVNRIPCSNRAGGIVVSINQGVEPT